MSGEQTEANMDSLATTITTPSSSRIGLELSAGVPVIVSSQLLSITSPPTLTPSLSLNTAEIVTSNVSNPSSSPSEYSLITTKANTSDPLTEPVPDLTPFPDLNLKIATLLAGLKNPSIRSTEELQSALVEADATLSAWKTELLNIDDDDRRERELKPAADMNIRPRSPITAQEQKDSFWEDRNQQKRLGVGIKGMELRVVGRLQPFLAEEAGPSKTPSRPSGPLPAAALEEDCLPLNLTTNMPHPADSLTPTGGRGQRAHKPRKFFGETSSASRDKKRGPHKFELDQTEKRTTTVGQLLPKQGALRAEPNNGVVGKRKRKQEAGNEEEAEEKAAVKRSRKIKTRVRSATPNPLQQPPRTKLKLDLKPQESAPASRANPVAFNAARTTHSASGVATAAAVAENAVVSEAASTEPSKFPA